MKIKVFVDEQGIFRAEVVNAVGLDSAVVVGVMDKDDVERLFNESRVALLESDWILNEMLMNESEGTENYDDVPFS
jgi:hypothetical protein